MTYPYFYRTDPDVRIVEDGALWGLNSPYFPVWTWRGDWWCMPIPRHFEWDAASVPRFLWWLVPRWKLGIKAPLKHDWLHHKKGLVEMWIWRGDQWESIGPRQWKREDADRMFFRDMRENENQFLGPFGVDPIVQSGFLVRSTEMNGREKRGGY